MLNSCPFPSQPLHMCMTSTPPPHPHVPGLHIIAVAAVIAQALVEQTDREANVVAALLVLPEQLVLALPRDVAAAVLLQEKEVGGGRRERACVGCGSVRMEGRMHGREQVGGREGAENPESLKTLRALHLTRQSTSLEPPASTSPQRFCTSVLQTE
jgi:hypothetical protein